MEPLLITAATLTLWLCPIAAGGPQSWSLDREDRVLAEINGPGLDSAIRGELSCGVLLSVRQSTVAGHCSRYNSFAETGVYCFDHQGL